MRRRRWIILVSIIILLLAGAGIYWRLRPVDDHVRTATVEHRDVRQEVLFTGRLRAAARAELGFAMSGTVQHVAVAVGDTVSAGQALMTIDPTVAELEAARARADLTSAQEQGQLAWERAVREADNVAGEQTQAIARRRQAVLDAKQELDQAKEVWLKTEAESGNDASTTASAYKAFLSSQSAYNSAQELLSEARLSAARLTDSASDAAALAREHYVATTQASSADAGLSSLEALARAARTAAAQRTLRAPFAGTVTAVAAEAGEVAGPAAAAVVVEQLDVLEVAAAVPEVDAVKLMPGMAARVAFDAYPATETWAATVTRIAPSAAVLEGVPTYEVILEIAARPERVLRPGLTASVTVQADQRAQVLAVPRRAVVTVGSREYVRVLGPDGALVERDVTTGLLGSDGVVEITAGLAAGEQVVTRQPGSD